MKTKLQKTKLHRTASLGELVVVAFDKAARYSANPNKVARLATVAVMRMLRRAGKAVGPFPESAAHHRAV
jgi:hypothetical protein